MASEKRLIDPTKYKLFLKRYIKELYEVDAPMIAGAVERCLYKLEGQPTVDAVEVVHGRWITEYWKSGHIKRCTCSECGESPKDAYKPDNYCPNCGAKMDGGNEDV